MGLFGSKAKRKVKKRARSEKKAVKKDARQDKNAARQEKRASGYMSPVAFATVYLGLDDREQALTWLESAYEERRWLASIPQRRSDDGPRTRRASVPRAAEDALGDGRSPIVNLNLEDAMSVLR